MPLVNKYRARIGKRGVRSCPRNASPIRALYYPNCLVPICLSAEKTMGAQGRKGTRKKESSPLSFFFPWSPVARALHSSHETPEEEALPQGKVKEIHCLYNSPQVYCPCMVIACGIENGERKSSSQKNY